MLHRVSKVASRSSSVVSLLFLPLLLCAQPDTLRLIFAGDIMGHSPQIKSAETGPGQYDYAPCFRYVKPVLQKADLAIGNLELTLPGKPPYTGYPMFRSPDALATGLKDAGFDILVTANNHSNDGHYQGVAHTIDVLRQQGFLQTGTFKSDKDRRNYYPLMVYQDGFKIAFLNYTYGTNGVPTEAPAVVNLIDTVQIKADLYEARARRPDCIIAVMHWGLEYQLTENAEQRQLARLLVAHGADLVIGAHPHVVQPVKKVSATAPDGTRREAVVVYSLGNFISNQQQANTDIGVLFRVDIVKNKGVSRARVGDYGFIPVWRYIHKSVNGKTTYFALPVSRVERNPDLLPGMPAASRAAMLRAAEGVRKRLAGCPEVF